MNKGTFGLDIGSQTIKVVELEKKGDRLHLLNFGMTDSPPGAIFSESKLDQDKLVKSVRLAIKENHIKSKNVVVSFPESLIFTRVISLPVMSEAELKNAIRWQAEQYVPVPVSDIKLSWQVLEGKPETVGRFNLKSKAFSKNGSAQTASGKQPPKMKVLLVAAPLSLIDRYMQIVQKAGLNPVVFETEILATVRSLGGPSTHQPTTAIVSIGASTTDICILDHGAIQFTRSIGTGGISLARSISQKLGFDLTQAEEYKKTYGLLEDQLGGKIMQIIKPTLDVIVSELDRAILSYQTHNPMQPVKRIVLTGGTAQLPGLVVYLAENLSLEVSIGNPWDNVEKEPGQQKMLERIEAQVNYAVAVGLAMR